MDCIREALIWQHTSAQTHSEPTSLSSGTKGKGISDRSGLDECSSACSPLSLWCEHLPFIQILRLQEQGGGALGKEGLL